MRHSPPPGQRTGRWDVGGASCRCFISDDVWRFCSSQSTESLQSSKTTSGSLESRRSHILTQMEMIEGEKLHLMFHPQRPLQRPFKRPLPRVHLCFRLPCSKLLCHLSFYDLILGSTFKPNHWKKLNQVEIGPGTRIWWRCMDGSVNT